VKNPKKPKFPTSRFQIFFKNLKKTYFCQPRFEPRQKEMVRSVTGLTAAAAAAAAAESS